MSEDLSDFLEQLSYILDNKDLDPYTKVGLIENLVEDEQ